jgi:hypothetical protein
MLLGLMYVDGQTDIKLLGIFLQCHCLCAKSSNIHICLDKDPTSRKWCSILKHHWCWELLQLGPSKVRHLDLHSLYFQRLHKIRIHYYYYYYYYHLAVAPKEY